MKVKVTEYKGFLVINTIKPEKDNNFIPVTEPGRIGSTIIETSKHLGMSKEAFAFLKKLRVSKDDVGDVDAWKTVDGTSCFSWMGPLKRLVGPDAELSSSGAADIDYIEIPNDETDENAKLVIDNS
jgi:hypothetical protein